MCWTGTIKEGTKKIADKDIFVYKVGYASDNGEIFRSYVFPYTYYKGKTSIRYKFELFKDSNICNKSIKRKVERGYHSFSEECEIRMFECFDCVYLSVSRTQNYICPIQVGKFVIPKGTAYCKNSNGEYVSEEIMYIGNMDISHVLSEVRAISFSKLNMID